MKQPSIRPNHRGCLNCPAPRKTLKLNRRIGVGFGFAAVKRNNEIVWSEIKDGGGVYEWDELWTVQKAENRARKHRGDWRIVLHGPMHGETYQRQGCNRWVCIESNGGFI